MNRSWTLAILVAAGLFLAPACRGEGAAPGPASTTPATSPITLPSREVTFTVKVPGNTPPGDTVYVLVMPFLDWTWTQEQHVALTPSGDGTWSGMVPVEEGALVRYTYDRWDERDWGEFKYTREASGPTIKIESRYLLVTPGLEEVRDTVETWNDLRASTPTGTVTGIVVDSATGEPVMDANVSVAGIHAASDYDGRFKVDGVASGLQRITVHRNLGDYRPETASVEVSGGGEAYARIEMERAEHVEVAFEVALPEDTPPDAEVRLAGSVFQAGARPGGGRNMPIMGTDLLLPRLDRVGTNRAAGKLDLHQGTYVQYFYSIGSSSHGREYDGEGRQVFRSFVVGPSSRTRHDQVAAWRPSEASVRVTLRLTVPSNTTPGVPIAFNTGPSHWMTRTGPDQWTFFLHGYSGQEVQYSYVLGADSLGVDGTDGLSGDGSRSFVFPESDAVLHQRVDRWLWSPRPVAAAPGEPVDVTFRVTVPPSTPPDPGVRLIGDGPTLSPGIGMDQQPGNPSAYAATVRLPYGESVSYRYDLGRPDVQSGRSHTMTVTQSGQVVNDWVTTWSASSPGAAGTRPGFITGIYTPDFWSDAFLELSSSTFERIRARNAGFVVVSSVWHYGQTQPAPVVEPRSIQAPSVLTPREDIEAQAAMAREMGLKVILGPQFNMEMVSGGLEAVCRSHPRDWLDAWLVEAERLWMWHAIVAEEIGAEALLLPGYCFHVFSPVDDTAEYSAEFDGKVAALMEKVRGVYGGKLIVSGSAREFDFPGLADFVGVTTYDTGHPGLGHGATVDQWREAYDELFAQAVDPIHQRWGKPVLFYTVHVPPVPGDPEPTGQETQAKRLEGIFQALNDRPWVAGTLSWAYSMIDAPLDPASDGLRARQAEAVLAKYYGLYTGP